MQAQPDFGRRKFCVYNMMASCLSLRTTKLFMETHFLGGKLEKKKTSQMEKSRKQKNRKQKLGPLSETCV